MAEFLLKCKCGQMQIYQKYISANIKHWVIQCKNCDAYVEAKEKEKAIEKWNCWEMYHDNKIHTKNLER